MRLHMTAGFSYYHLTTISTLFYQFVCPINSWQVSLWYVHGICFYRVGLGIMCCGTHSQVILLAWICDNVLVNSKESGSYGRTSWVKLTRPVSHLSVPLLGELKGAVNHFVCQINKKNASGLPNGITTTRCSPLFKLSTNAKNKPPQKWGTKTSTTEHFSIISQKKKHLS